MDKVGIDIGAISPSLIPVLLIRVMGAWKLANLLVLPLKG
jgi:hypothetical protein